MKKVFLPLLLVIGFKADAQSLESIKNQFVLQQYSKAKTDIDKAMQNTEFISKPEAYLLKSAIYSALAADALKTNPAQAESLAAEGDVAFIKYRQKDAAMPLVNDAVYQLAPTNLYSVYYTAAYNDYSVKKWNTAFDKISKAVVYSDLLIQKKLLAATLDTNVLILAGITAENCNKKDEAAMYYSRLADAGITGEGFESVYRYLVNYYFGKNIMPSFEKYKAQGKSHYPNSEYFTYDKVDFAIGTATGFENQYAAAQSLVKSDPDNFKANEVLGEIIYDELNKRLKQSVNEQDIQSLEANMVNAFYKAASLQPGYVNSYLYIGDYFINKAVAINDKKVTITDPAGQKLLDAQYGKALLAAGEPYEKAAAIFAKNNSLDQKDKAQYKKAVSYLGDIASYKKQKALNETEKAKWAAEASKWDALYSTIK